MKPPIHWYGGKTLQTKNLLPYIPEHHCYVEPYGGSGALLFAKEPSKVEVYNDLHEEVTGLYSVLQSQFSYEEFMRYLTATPYARDELKSSWEYLEWLRSGDDEVQDGKWEFDLVCRAKCFFVLARQSFSARHNTKPGWSSSKQSNHALAWMNAIDGLPEIHKRLQNVQIECRPALEVIKQYDSKETFMYLDPPYLAETRKEKQAYEHEMNDNDHFALLCLTKQLEGMVLLSGYHHTMYDDVLSGWHCKDFEVTSTAIDTTNTDANTRRTETIWWNDALEDNRVGAQQHLDLEVY